jgi:hypothetical protein
MRTMPGLRWRMASAILCTGVLACGCSSSKTTGEGPTTNRGSSPSADAGQVAVQMYLAAVNALCDELLPKVDAVTKGGSLDIPLKEFFAQLPAHQKLRDDFDRQLAKVPVPAEAKQQQSALNDYLNFANELDAKRLRAARQGQTSYDKEISAEKESTANDPSIAARTAAGFNESCNAR